MEQFHYFIPKDRKGVDFTDDNSIYLYKVTIRRKGKTSKYFIGYHTYQGYHITPCRDKDDQEEKYKSLIDAPFGEYGTQEEALIELKGLAKMRLEDT